MASSDLVRPMGGHIAYMSGYKYQLYNSVSFLIPSLRKYAPINHMYFSVDLDGLLTIKIGYAWDGASGPAINTANSKRGSLVHDVLYQMMRLELILLEYKKTADQILEALCVLDGMWEWRAGNWYDAVASFGTSATLPSHRKQLKYAP